MPLSRGLVDTSSVPSGNRLWRVEGAAERDALPLLYRLRANTGSWGVTSLAVVACGGTALQDPDEGCGGGALLNATTPS